MIPEREKELLLLLRKDDRSAIQVLFNQYHASLCSLSYRIVKDKELAKDVVQDVFIKFWKGRNGFIITSSIEAYLKRAVVNTSLNAVEKSARQKSIPLEQSGDLHLASDSAESSQSYNELQEKVDRAIDLLPVRTRAVFALIRFEEMSYIEVSQTLDISTKAVEKEMVKALRLLREALKEFLPMILASVLAF